MSSAEKYAQMIHDAIKNGDHDCINMIANIVVMSEKAKNNLRKKGYGWTGLDLLKTCELVPENDRS